MRNTDHGYIHNFWMFGKNFLDITGKDIDAARDDHVLFPVQDIEVTILIKFSDIPGLQVGSSPLISPYCLRGLFRLLIVSPHQRGAIPHDFPDLSPGKFLPLIVNDANISSHDRGSYRSDLSLHLFWLQGCANSLGNSVEL